MAIVYKIETNLGVEEVADLYRSAGLRRPVDDALRMQRMLANANLILCAREESADTAVKGKLVGIARSLTDYAHCCYLADLAVHADYQRQGIGQELIRQVQLAITEEAMLLLLAAPLAADYYPHIGFDKVENGWMIPRKC